MRSKTKARYQGFALEIPLIEEIKKCIIETPRFRSVTDFVRTAVREKLEKEDKHRLARDFYKKAYFTIISEDFWPCLPKKKQDELMKRLQEVGIIPKESNIS
jgi:hypothetical protein